ERHARRVSDRRVGRVQREGLSRSGRDRHAGLGAADRRLVHELLDRVQHGAGHHAGWQHDAQLQADRDGSRTARRAFFLGGPRDLVAGLLRGVRPGRELDPPRLVLTRPRRGAYLSTAPMTTALTLYDFQGSPCARRVRIVLLEKGLAWTTHIVDLTRMEQ